jgi:hypothetical protein
MKILIILFLIILLILSAILIGITSKSYIIKTKKGGGLVSRETISRYLEHSRIYDHLSNLKKYICYSSLLSTFDGKDERDFQFAESNGKIQKILGNEFSSEIDEEYARSLEGYHIDNLRQIAIYMKNKIDTKVYEYYTNSSQTFDNLLAIILNNSIKLNTIIDTITKRIKMQIDNKMRELSINRQDIDTFNSRDDEYLKAYITKHLNDMTSIEILKFIFNKDQLQSTNQLLENLSRYFPHT